MEPMLQKDHMTFWCTASRFSYRLTDGINFEQSRPLLDPGSNIFQLNGGYE
jgi:hypothetical protein